MLIGQNEPPLRKGEPAFVKGDQGKLNIVRYRGTPKPRGKVATATRALVPEVPIVKGEQVVVYSLALPELEEDEQLVLPLLDTALSGRLGSQSGGESARQED